jgi:hypothetical protein
LYFDAGIEFLVTFISLTDSPGHMKKLYPVLILAILALMSCEFEPSGEFSPDITEPGEAPPVWIDLNVEDDTIVLVVEGSVNFSFQTAGRKLHLIRVCLGYRCEIYESNTGSFKISMHENIWPGTHDLTIEIYTGTGSGSIADVLGAEGFLYSRTWTVIVHSFITPEEGRLKLRWNKYNGHDFKEYAIVKTPEGAESYTLAVIEDKDRTFAYDSFYFGEKAEYRVEVVANNNKIDWISGIYDDGLPRVSNEVDNHILTLAWDKSEYIENLTGYEIYGIDHIYRTYTLLAEITDKNITSYSFNNLKFAKFYEFAFLLVPRRMPAYTGGLIDRIKYLGSTTSNLIGEVFEGSAISTPLGDFMYYKFTDHTNTNYIYEYNYIKQEITDKIKVGKQVFEHAVSPNRKYILIVDFFKTVLLYNTDTKGIKTYTLDDFPGNYYSATHPTISNSGKGAIHLYSPKITGDPSHSTLIYDFAEDKSVFLGRLSPYNFYYQISANAQYFAEHGYALYRVLSDTVMVIPEFSSELSDGRFWFHMSDPELYIIAKDEYVYVKRISDQSTVSEFHLAGERLASIDYNANKFLTTSIEKMHLCDFTTGEELWSYPMAFGYREIRFCYNTVYDSGVRRKLRIE